MTLSQFLTKYYQQTAFADLEIGTIAGLPVRIVKDSEYADRFFLVFAADGMIEITIVDPLAGDVVCAAEQLAADFTSSG